VDEGEKLIRDIWRRWNEGERSPEIAEMDPEFEVHSALTSNVYVGADAVRTWIGEIEEQFESWELQIDEVEASGPNSYVVLGRIRARGRTSGVDLDQPARWLIDVRDGRMRRIRNFIA
jgi:ketosteroid isomerase-like protein